MGLLPLIMHVCGCTLHQLLDVPNSDTNAAGCNKHDSQSDNSLSRTRKESHVHWKTFVLICLISTNLPIALYTCLIHQRGTIDVMTFLYAEAQRPAPKDLMDVLFLMPCHSTPFYRYESLILKMFWHVIHAAVFCAQFHCSFMLPMLLQDCQQYRSKVLQVSQK